MKYSEQAFLNKSEYAEESIERSKLTKECFKQAGSILLSHILLIVSLLKLLIPFPTLCLAVSNTFMISEVQFLHFWASKKLVTYFNWSIYCTPYSIERSVLKLIKFASCKIKYNYLQEKISFLTLSEDGINHVDFSKLSSPKT